MEWMYTRFAGYDCVQMRNSSLTLWLTRTVGPRIIGLTVGDGDNLFALLPDATTATPDGMLFRFRGGHRLWHAPEHPEHTYVPDDAPVKVASDPPDSLSFTQPTEASTGIQKQLSVALADDSPTVSVNHTITNHSQEPVKLAPWAITQLKPGGFAVLPMPQEATGLLPNRRLSLWPYTRINSPHLRWGDRYVFVDANMESGKLKIGWGNSEGWLGYWINNILFVKQAPYQPEAQYFDYGSSSECYCDPRFLELETLGPQTILAPGQSVSHLEVWRLFPDVGLRAEESFIQEALSRLDVGPRPATGGIGEAF
jgi:hypothetical protein